MKAKAILVALTLLLTSLPAVAAGPASEGAIADGSIFVSAQAGSDANDCLSWGTACKTIMAGVGKLNASKLAGTVNIGAGLYRETVALTVGGQTIRGVAPGTFSMTRGVVIQPPCDTCDGIDIQAGQSGVENIGIRGLDAGWDGAAIHIGITTQNTNGTVLRNIPIQNVGFTPTASSGGVGILIHDSEDAVIEQISCSAIRLCIQLGTPTRPEGTENTFIGVHSSVSYQDLVQYAGSGGDFFYRFKGVGGLCSSVNLLDLRGSNNILADLDLDEGCRPNALSVSGYNNLFEGGTVSPESTLTVSGLSNRFVNYTILNVAIVTGTANEFDGPFIQGALSDQGTNTIIENPHCRIPASCQFNATTRQPVYYTAGGQVH